jgi:hypothetical protein
VARRKHDAPLLARLDARTRAAKICRRAPAHFYKHHSAVRLAQDQVNFAATAPWRPIIAIQQAQSCGLQVGERPVFGLVASRTRGFTGRRAVYRLLKESH